MGFLFENEVTVVSCNDFGTACVDADYYPASASFIDMSGIEHGVFLVKLGGEDSAMTFAVYQDTSATATGSIAAVTSASQAAGTGDDNKFLTIEFNANQLNRAGGFRYVTLKQTGAAGSNDYCQVFFLGFGHRKQPVTKDAAWLYHVAVVS